MYFIKATWLGLIALLILPAGDCKLYAGSMTYTWYGPAGAGGLELISDNRAGNRVIQPVPMGPAVVQISYDPSQSQDNAFYFSINSTPVGFFQSIPGFMVISAPPPGGGLDSITFYAKQIFYTVESGYVEILAPNGTLASSGQMPANLSAFESFGFGSYGYGVNTSPYFPEYFAYEVDGSLGGAPEPSTIVSMTIGMSLSFCFVFLRSRRRRRVAGVGSPRRGSSSVVATVV
jgi:hypothetical protein